jgi:2,3-bisphosphoglycerate-independent phosphoglycerate mutase
MEVKGSTQRVLLCICDGMGYSDNEDKNAVKDAHTPNLDSIFKTYPFTTIQPGGELVGLPKGVAGNSEVGHMNLGAGRPVRQDLVRINEAIEKNTLKDMPHYKELIEKTKQGSGRLHLMGLLSDGGVHSHIRHLEAIINLLKEEKDIEVFFHAFMDGRDTPKTNGPKYIQEVLDCGGCTFASMQGRSIGMDRDRRWEKIEHAYKTLTGTGATTDLSALDYLASEYEKNIYDEFITPVLLDKNGAIQKDDSVFFINFRPDRAKQISLAFCDAKFEHFDNAVRPAYYLCMSPYIDEELPEVPILFDREKVAHTLSEYISKLGKKQLKIAETEKYAHVTYFFNGGEEKPFEGEDRILIDSPKDVPTYDHKPEMSAPIVLENLLAKLDDDSYTLYVVNFANPDMVGHTGNYQAAVKAMEYIDSCIGKLRDKCLEQEIAMLITADHGNCDQMTYPDGSPHTSHSNAPVPFTLIEKNLENVKIEVNHPETNALKDVAPTILHLLGLEKPAEFDGDSIFI